MNTSLLARSSAKAEAEDINLLELLGTLWRGKWRILLITLAGLVFGASYLFGVAEPLYTARAEVVLETPEDPLINLQGVPANLDLAGARAEIETQMVVLQSRDLVGAVVRALNLTADPEFNLALLPSEPPSLDWWKEALLGPEPPMSEEEIFASTVDEVLEGISIAALGDSQALEIVVQTTAAHKSARMASCRA